MGDSSSPTRRTAAELDVIDFKIAEALLWTDGLGDVLAPAIREAVANVRRNLDSAGLLRAAVSSPPADAIERAGDVIKASRWLEVKDADGRPADRAASGEHIAQALAAAGLLAVSSPEREAEDWEAKFRIADRHVFDQIRQRHDAAEALGVVEEVLVARCQHATDDNEDLRSALLELRIVRSRLDPRRAAVGVSDEQ